MYRTRYKKKWCEKWLKLWNWELHVILKVLPDGNWPSVTCLVICINRNCHLISALRNGWKLISPSKSFVVYAATSTEKHQWMSHIKKCVDDLLIKRMCWQTCLSGSFHQNIRSPFFCNVKVIVKGQGHSLRPMLYFPRIDNSIKLNHEDGLYNIKTDLFCYQRSRLSSNDMVFWQLLIVILIQAFSSKSEVCINLLYNVLRYMYFWNRC